MAFFFVDGDNGRVVRVERDDHAIEGRATMFLVAGVVGEEEVHNVDGAAGDVKDAGDGFAEEFDVVVNRGANNRRERS